jgi:hypothetical protein
VKGGRGGQGKKNKKEKDLITYVDKPSTKTQGQRREGWSDTVEVETKFCSIHRIGTHPKFDRSHTPF